MSLLFHTSFGTGIVDSRWVFVALVSCGGRPLRRWRQTIMLDIVPGLTGMYILISSRGFYWFVAMLDNKSLPPERWFNKWGISETTRIIRLLVVYQHPSGWKNICNYFALASKATSNELHGMSKVMRFFLQQFWSVPATNPGRSLGFYWGNFEECSSREIFDYLTKTRDCNQFYLQESKIKVRVDLPLVHCVV